MRIIVAGGRDFTDYAYMRNTLVPLVKFTIRNRFEVLERKDPNFSDEPIIICGCASGADTMGETIAKEEGWKIERYPADWQKHGKSAGYKRNLEMAKVADKLIAYWDGKSRGTKHMIDISKERLIPTLIFRYRGEVK
jgi:hypothetical protein